MDMYIGIVGTYHSINAYTNILLVYNWANEMDVESRYAALTREKGIAQWNE